MATQDSVPHTDPEWERIVEVPRGANGKQGKRQLLGALLTSYAAPDSAVLVEHLLPELLSLERPFADDPTDGRYLFFAELDRSLKALQRRLSIFCSSDVASSGTPDQAYPWLFRYVRCFRVGRTDSAVQHAKLWMFHWGGGPKDEEFLEIVISSCNLTSDALEKQLQAGWRCIVPLRAGGSKERQRGWGMLPTFLEALARSSAADAKSVVRGWTDLLSRASPPTGSVFLASIPGSHTSSTLRSTPLGMMGLRHVVPRFWHETEVDILVPSIGLWKAEGIRKWASQVKAMSTMLRIAWPPCTTGNHWFPTHGMSMPPGTCKSFKGAGVRLLAWPPECDEPWASVFHEKHHETDHRWPHCKLYWFGRRHRREAVLLVTSANFSNAAWGHWKATRLQIDNFELGVAFPVKRRPLLNLSVMEGKPYVGGAILKRSTFPIEWADARWDGFCIRLEVRLSKETRPSQLKVSLVLDGASRRQMGSLKYRRTGRIHRTKIPWATRKGIPAALYLIAPTKDQSATVIPVADMRPPDAALETPCPEIPEEWQDAEVRVILEQYGGRIADTEERPPPQAPSAGRNGDGAVPADYRVGVIEAARQNWRIIDCWEDKLARVDRSMRLMCLGDGRKLRDYWLDVASKKHLTAVGINSALAARLAAREIGFRLERRQT